MIASGESSWHTRAELEGLFNQLIDARSCMPDALQSSSQNLTFRATTSSFTTFVMLHAHWHQIFCDLHRFLIPGMRESVSPQAFAATPPDYVERCQQQCLPSAQNAIDPFVRVHDLPNRKRIDDSLFGVIAYYCAQVLTAGLSWSASGTASLLRLQLRKTCSLIEKQKQAIPF